MEYPMARNILKLAIRTFGATQWMSMKGLSARCGVLGRAVHQVLGFPSIAAARYSMSPFRRRARSCKMWNQWNERTCKDQNTSPIKGLFPGEASAAAGSNGS